MVDTANELLGTCKSLNDVLASRGLIFEELSSENCQVLDDNTVLCEGCGWWIEPEELNENQVCGQCAEDGIEV